MIIIVILFLIAIAAVGAWQYQLSQANALAAQVELARIASQNRLDLAPWVILALLIIAVAVVAVFYFRRPRPVVNDNRTVILLQPGASRREFYKAISCYDALPLSPGETTKKLRNRDVKLLKG